MGAVELCRDIGYRRAIQAKVKGEGKIKAIFLSIIILATPLFSACVSGEPITYTSTQTQTITQTQTVTIPITITTTPPTITQTVTPPPITITTTVTVIPPASTQTFLITKAISYIITNWNDHYWYFSWQITVKNIATQSMTAYIEVHFLNAQGFSLDWTNEIVTFTPQEEKTILGEKIVEASIAPDIVSATAEIEAF